jgi:hypothetical protein
MHPLVEQYCSEIYETDNLSVQERMHLVMLLTKVYQENIKQTEYMPIALPDGEKRGGYDTARFDCAARDIRKEYSQEIDALSINTFTL